MFPSQPWQIFHLTQAAALAIPRVDFQLSCGASWFVTKGSAILAFQYCLVKAALNKASFEIPVAATNLLAHLQNNDQHKHKECVALLHEFSWTQLISQIFHSALLCQRQTLKRFDFRDTLLAYATHSAVKSPLSLFPVGCSQGGYWTFFTPRAKGAMWFSWRVWSFTTLSSTNWWRGRNPQGGFPLLLVSKISPKVYWNEGYLEDCVWSFRQEVRVKASVLVALRSFSVPFNGQGKNNRWGTKKRKIPVVWMGL